MIHNKDANKNFIFKKYFIKSFKLKKNKTKINGINK